MKRLIALTFTLLAPLGCQATQSYGYAMVKDKDGFVNLRADDSLHSAIMQRLPNDTVVSANCVDYSGSANKNFCFALADNNLAGYIYKNRLAFFNDNTNLVQVPIVKDDNPLSASYNDNHYKVSAEIAVEPVIIYPEKFSSHNPNNEGCPDFYDSICSFGLEGFHSLTNLPQNFYKFGKITFQVNGKTIHVPTKDLAGLYISEHAVAHHDVFTHTNLYADPTTQHLYLLSRQSNGAGTFTVVYEVDNQGKVSRHAWLETI